MHSYIQQSIISISRITKYNFLLPNSIFAHGFFLIYIIHKYDTDIFFLAAFFFFLLYFEDIIS